MPGFGNDPSSTPSSLVAAATPGTEQCHSAREDVTRAAESRSRAAQLLHQESGEKPLPQPSGALGHG